MSTRADKFFTGDCVFAFGAAHPGALPPPHLPEFVFIGRSNAGKSSLLNALTGQAKLAHVSATPGRTQQLNFFRLNDCCFLVDVPGYGYAKAAKNKVAGWQGTLKHYLRARPVLKRIFVLIDARHGILAADETMLTELDRAAQSYQIVLTKADEVPTAKHAALQEATLTLASKHVAAYPELLITSSKTKLGITGLRTVIYGLL
ncbi:MAG: YihA family ribosome biogenesis GTP-binding protein [Alphaproteobacteria bacterium]|nr:YihA family ribosome biogenesis GTP-binding protein [Alphaproteobacteria bacterium]